MSSLQSLSGEIINLLKKNNRRLSIIEISTMLNRDRRTVSKTLEILRYTGRIKMRQQGRKKVVSLEEAIQPISFDINSYSLLIVLNSDFSIQWVNDGGIRVIGFSREVLVGKRIDTLHGQHINFKAISDILNILYLGETRIIEDWQNINDKPYFFRYTLSFFRTIDNNFMYIIIGEDITEKKRLEKNILENEEKYRSLSENIPGIVFRRYLQTNKIELFGDYFQVMPGYIPEEVVNSCINVMDRCIFPDDREKVIDTIQLAINTQNEYEVEYRIRDKNSHSLYFLERGKPISDISGNPVYIDGIILDITERKLLETELQANEAQLHSIFSLAGLAIVLCDEQGNWIRWNKYAQEILGFSDADLRHFSGISNIYPDDLKSSIEHMVPLFTGKIPSSRFELRYLRKDGSVIWFDQSLVPIRNSSGEIKFLISAGQDISHKKAMEIKLKESEERFRGIFNSAFQFIALLSRDGKVLDVNETMLVLGGLTIDQVRGIPFWNTLWWTVSEKIQEDLQEAIKEATSGKLVRYETVILGSDKQTINIDFSLKPIFTHSGQVTSLIYEGWDITQRLEIETKLKNSNTFLKQILEISPSLIYITEYNNRNLIFTNGKIQKFLGYSDKEALDNTSNFIRKIFHPYYKDFLSTHNTKFTQAGDDEVLEIMFPGKHVNGDWKWLHSREVIFSRTPDGLPKEILGIVQDLTKQKKTEAQLILYKGLLDASNEIADLDDSEENFIYINSTHTNFQDQSGNKPIPGIYQQYFDKKPIDITNGIVTPNLKHENYWISELEVIDSGEKRCMSRESVGSPLDDPDKLQYSFGIHDLPSQTQLNRKIQQIQTNFNESHLNTHIGSAIYNPKNQEFKWSEGMYNICGLEPRNNAPSFSEFLNLIHPDDRQNLTVIKQKIDETGVQEKFDFRIIRPDGALRLIQSWYLSFHEENGGKSPIIIFLYDCTEQ